MNKVICIHNGPLLNEIGLVNTAYQLKEGEVYTIKSVDIESKSYELVEVETPEMHCGYNMNRFIPLSDINETEEVEKLLQSLEAEYYEQFIKI